MKIILQSILFISLILLLLIANGETMDQKEANFDRGQGRSLFAEKKNVMRMDDNGKWIVTEVEDL